MDKSRLQLHFIYTTIFLLFCLVLMATDRWTGQKNFTEYLTNVATMVSLVLALVAIFYSFITNIGLTQSLGNIERVSNDIASTRTAMQEFVSESHTIVNSGNENAVALQIVSEQVAKEINSLQITLGELRGENAKIRESLIPIPERIEQLSARIAEAAPAASSTLSPTKDDSADPEELALRFLKRSSLVGVAVALGIALAYSSKKGLDCKRIGEIVGSTGTYVHGFIVALHSTGVIQVTAIKNKQRVIEVTRLAPFIEGLTLEQALADVRRRGLNSEEDWCNKIQKVFTEFTV